MKTLLIKKIKKYKSLFNLLSNLELLFFSYVNYLTKRDFIKIRKIICYNKKILFYLIYKVANTSIYRVLLKEKTIEKYDVSKGESKYYKFAFVRNPYDRLVSCYKNKFNKNVDTFHFRRYKYVLWPFKVYKFDINDSFEEFVMKISKIPDYLSDGHFKSQFAFLPKKFKVDYIGKYENLEANFELIRKQFDLEKLSHINQTKKTNWRDYYTLKLAKLVYERYKIDFDLWYPTEYQNLVKYLKTKK